MDNRKQELTTEEVIDHTGKIRKPNPKEWKNVVNIIRKSTEKLGKEEIVQLQKTYETFNITRK